MTSQPLPLTREQADRVRGEGNHHLQPLVGHARYLAQNPTGTLDPVEVATRITDATDAVDAMIATVPLAAGQAAGVSAAFRARLTPVARHAVSLAETDGGTLDPSQVATEVKADLADLDDALGLPEYGQSMEDFKQAIHDGRVESGHDLHCPRPGCQTHTFLTAAEGTAHATTAHATTAHATTAHA